MAAENCRELWTVDIYCLEAKAVDESREAVGVVAGLSVDMALVIVCVYYQDSWQMKAVDMRGGV